LDKIAFGTVSAPTVKINKRIPRIEFDRLSEVSDRPVKIPLCVVNNPPVMVSKCFPRIGLNGLGIGLNGFIIIPRSEGRRSFFVEVLGKSNAER